MTQRLILIWILFGMVGCGQPAREPVSTRNDAKRNAGKDIRKVENEGDLITIYPASSTPSDRLLNLSLFNGFHPKMTIQEAVRRHGSPDSRGKDDYGPFWVYRRPAGEIRLSYQEHGSPPFAYSQHWIVSAHPQNHNLSEVLADDLLGYVPEREGPVHMVIVRENLGAELDILIEHRRVSQVRWLQEYNVPEMRPTKPTQEQ